ncbi:restriction endonuclease subunit S [Mycoplasmopsis bovis]|uniref:restriction endonuclease subunit S n=1 Tax=Mycoplasmopsis bovis TaxID=28903 RepID=UPI00287F9BE2|nr:restriction endonuclease subunit S [Mycoplasmopsis bovis]QQH19443.2 restriction endonuclease subunit S [Mycoplasmopsis bovis]
MQSVNFVSKTNSWEQEKLGECSKFYNGLTSVSKSDFGVGKDLYIDYLNVFNNTFSQFSELKKFKNSSRQNYVQFKDVILTISSETPDEVAMSSVINWKNDYKNVAFNSFCILVRFNQLEKYDVNYIGYFFRSNSFRTQAMLMAQGISRFNINQTALKKTLFLFPPNIYEQQKIGNVLYYLDSLITLHQRKLSSLKNLKNRLLDRMFCDEKSQFPSIRFTEFTNAWEQKKLRNVVSYHSSMMIASDVKKYGKFDVYDPNKIVGKTDAEPFRSDYISIVKDGDAGRIRLLPKNTMILSTMGALIAKGPFKIDFLYYMLNAINDLSRERNGSIIPHIYFKDYGQNIYNLPSIPEQSKISSLFTYLDSLITLHQRG